jgi:hypothetical protein
MIGNIPSYGDYVRQGSGGPQGTCRVCGFSGATDHGLTGYECPKCHSMDVVLQLKENRVYHQIGQKVKPAAANGSHD